MCISAVACFLEARKGETDCEVISVVLDTCLLPRAFSENAPWAE